MVLPGTDRRVSDAGVVRGDGDMAMSCTICSAPPDLEFRLEDIDLYRCPDCDHCFSDQSRVPVGEGYGPEYYEVVHKRWFLHPNIDLFERIWHAISAARSDSAVLDVGCGKGDLLKYLRGKSPNLALTGIDLSPNQPAPGIEFISADFMNFDMGRQFDAVTSLASIEHVQDVRGFVRRLYDLCAPGGLVIIMTLNDRSLLYKVARVLHRIGIEGPFKRLYDKHHINHFNVSSLRRLVKQQELSVLTTLRHNAPLAAIDFPASSWLGDRILRTGVWATFALGRLTGMTYLQTIVCQRSRDGR